MADNYQISVGVKADFSDLKSQSQQGAAALEDFQTRGAKAVQAFQAAAAEGSEATEFLNKQMKELGAAGVAVVPAMEQAVQALRAVTAAEEADAAAAKAAAAAKRELSAQTSLAATEMRVFEGSTMGSARAAGMFATQSLGLGPIVAAAFPVIGAAAMGMMLVQLIGTIGKFASDADALGRELGSGWLDGAIAQLSGLGKEIKQVDDRILQLDQQRDRAKEEQREQTVEHIRITQGPAAGDYAKGTALQEKIDALEETRKRAKAEADRLEAEISSPEELSRVGSLGIDALRKQVDQQVAEYQTALEQEKKLLQEKDNLYEQAQKEQERQDQKGQHAGVRGQTENYSDDAAAQRMYGADPGAMVLYWENIVATTGKYHEQLLRSEEVFQKELNARRSKALGGGAGLGPEPGSTNWNAMFAPKETRTDLTGLSVSTLQGMQKSIAPLGNFGLSEADQAEYERIQHRITQIQQEEARKRERGTEEEARKEQQAFQRLFQSITGPFNQFVNHWITSGRNMGQAFAQMGNQMAANFIRAEMQMLEKHLQVELQKRLATAVSNQVQVATTAAAKGETDVLETQGAMKSLEKSAAKAAGKAWSALADIPIVGPALGAIAAGATFAGIMALAAFEQGGVVQGPMGSMVPIAAHAGERVLSVAQTRNFETMVNNVQQGGSGQGGIHFHDHSNFTGIDGASVAGMARSHGQTFRRETMRQLRLMNKV